MPTANDQLRTARELTASPTHPDECVSRQELAELINAYIWHHHKKMVALDANYLGKLERGCIRWPDKLYREALRAILNVPTDAALGFTNARRAVVKLVHVNRNQFIRAGALGIGTLTLGPVAALLEGDEPSPLPIRVGPTEIEQVRTAARVFESWDSTYGGGFGRDAALAQLRWSAGLLNATCPDRLRAELFSAVGDLASEAGFMAFDAYAHDEARRVLRFALGCAEEADDWHLRATILADMATQEIWTGQPDEGLTLTEHALVRADRLTATERAMLHTTRARALSTMHRVRETLTAVGTADDHFAHSDPANDPPFTAGYDAARHARHTGHALFELAMLGHDPARATDRLAAAVVGHTAPYIRSRALSQIKFASLTMATGDPIEAAALGTAALDTAATIRSRRATDDLRELARHATRHPKIDEVTELRQRITTALLAS
ncbi:MAG: XRE family transcriptional regulator [Pseudonocardia sp.]